MVRGAADRKLRRERIGNNWSNAEPDRYASTSGNNEVDVFVYLLTGKTVLTLF